MKAIIFDCFGVLITDALESVVDELAKTSPEKAAEVRETIVAANQGTITRETSSATVAGLLGISIDEYRRIFQEGEVKNYELLAYIKELRLHYKTALLSNVSRGGLKLRFAQDELQAYFEVVVASGDVGFAKPEPEAYELTADRLGVRLNECVMIDDREDYCEGARGVGMQVILYRSFDQMKRDLDQILTTNSTL